MVDLTQSCASLDAAIGWLVKAVASRLTTARRLLAALNGRHRLRWRHVLTEALADVAEGCHSMLELRYAHRVERAHGLPRGRRQHRRGGWYDVVDYAARLRSGLPGSVLRRKVIRAGTRTTFRPNTEI